jgi:hypothetical protein
VSKPSEILQPSIIYSSVTLLSPTDPVKMSNKQQVLTSEAVLEKYGKALVGKTGT